MKLRGRREVLLVAAILLGGSCILLGPALFSGDVLSAGDKLYFQAPFAAERPAGLERPSNRDLSDAVDVFHPHLLEAREALRAGELPAWNTHIEAGRPIGAQNGGPFFPLHWLAYVLPFWQSLELIALLKLLVAGAGTFVLARRLGVGTAGAVLGAASFTFGLPFVVSLEHPQAAVFGLLPWLLAAAHWMVRGEGGARAALACGGLIGVAQLAGHPESTFVLVAGFLAFTAYSATEPGALPARQVVLSVAAVAGIALAVAAITLIPTLVLLSDSLEPGRDAPPLALKTLQSAFFPEAWGRPDKLLFEQPAGTSFAYRAMYIGAAPLVLAVGGLAARRSAPQVFFAGVAAACGLLVLDLPVVPDVVNALPMFSLVNEWHFIFLAVFSVAMLAGFGLDALLGGTREERKRLAACAVAVAALPALWLLLTTPAPPGGYDGVLHNLLSLADDVDSPELARVSSGIRWALFAGAAAVLAVAVWRWPRRAGPALVAAVAIGLVLADLIPLGAGYHPAVAQDRADPPPTRAIRYMQRNAGDQRVAGFGPALYPNASQRYGLDDARGEDLPERDRFGRVWTGFGGDFFQEYGLKVITRPGEGRTGALLDLMAVRYVVDDGAASPPSGLRRTPIDETGQRVLENPRAFPRAWVAYGSRRADAADDAIEQTLASSTAELRRRPVLEDLAGASGRGGPTTAASVTESRRGRLTVTATARDRGVLVVSDAYDAGWHAKVDGKDARVIPANGVFRAVAIPRGRHVVELSYRSSWLTASAVATGLGMLVVLAGIALGGLRRRRRPAQVAADLPQK